MRETRSTTISTTEAAIEKVREICLSFPDTREGSHFGESAFYVKGRLFATCGAKNGACEITFGLEPEDAAALVKSDPRFRPYPRDRRGVVMDAAAVTRWSEVRKHLAASYALVKPAGARRKPAGKTAGRKGPRR